MTKKKRIILALDDKYILQLDHMCKRLNVKQYSKVIKYLLDLINLGENLK